MQRPVCACACLTCVCVCCISCVTYLPCVPYTLVCLLHLLCFLPIFHHVADTSRQTGACAKGEPRLMDGWINLASNAAAVARAHMVSSLCFPFLSARLYAFAWSFGSDAVSDVINSHHYTNSSDATCLAVLQAGMVGWCHVAVGPSRPPSRVFKVPLSRSHRPYILSSVCMKSTWASVLHVLLL